MKSFTQVRTLAILLSIASTGSSSFAALKHSHHEGQKLCNFAPENDLRIPVNGFEKIFGGIDKQQFNQIVAKVTEVYAPIVETRGAKLEVKNLWEDDTVNASAEQSGNAWVVNAYGGLARHPLMTADAMMMVLCHEMGHHLAGAPRMSSFFGGSWASVEGQSDYYATMKCWRRMTLKEDNVGIISSMSIPKIVSDQCAVQFKEKNELALCQRGTMVGKTLADLLWDLGKGSSANGPKPSFENPDPSVVKKTYEAHPKAQCRLDTYFAGAMCPVDFSVDFDKTDATKGACNAEKGDKLGFRSTCWYKAKKGELELSI